MDEEDYRCLYGRIRYLQDKLDDAYYYGYDEDYIDYLEMRIANIKEALLSAF